MDTILVKSGLLRPDSQRRTMTDGNGCEAFLREIERQRNDVAVHV